MALKSECAGSMPVELGGLDAQREFLATSYELTARTLLPVSQEFYSLAYVHAGHRPKRRLGLHSPMRGEPYIIQLHEWENLWFEGEQILLAGWLTHEGFRSKAVVLNVGMPTFQFAHTRTKNLLVHVDALNPLGRLLEKVREWEDGKKKQPPDHF